MGSRRGLPDANTTAADDENHATIAIARSNADRRRKEAEAERVASAAEKVEALQTLEEIREIREIR